MKTTLATIKSFVRKNEGNLFINCKSSFDGMVDCVMPVNGGFAKATKDNDSFYNAHTLGIKGTWFVGGSRDYFREYDADGMKGFEISNCCGHFILAVKK